MNTYYLHDGRNEAGPFTIETLQKQKLTRTTPIRLTDTDQWMPAEKLPELKAVLSPRRISSAKDVVPAVVESVTYFRYRRPKTASAILVCAAVLAAVSIYSSGSKAAKAEALAAMPPAVSVTLPAVAPQLSATVTSAKETPAVKPEDAKKKADRQRWNKLFSVASSNYGIGFLGGIKDLTVVVTNRSDYPLDQAVAKVTYIKANGEVWKTSLVTFYGIPAHDSKEEKVPDVGRSKRATVSIQKLVSKKLNFIYVAGKKSTEGDPYKGE